MPGPQLGQATVEQMRERPHSLLTIYPQGGSGLRGAAAQMAATGIKTLEAVTSVVTEASERQHAAIGLGLADAARECMMQDAAVVQRITAAAKSSGSATLRRSFVMATSNDDVASPGAVAGGTAPGPGAGPASQIDMYLGITSSRDPMNFPDPFGASDSWH